jgi:nucleoside-diphosphate-sugar epimerase
MHELIPNVPPPQFVPPRAGDLYRSVGSPQKAIDVLGFHAEVPLVDGLQETIDWMRA